MLLRQLAEIDAKYLKLSIVAVMRGSTYVSLGEESGFLRGAGFIVQGLRARFAFFPSADFLYAHSYFNVWMDTIFGVLPIVN